MVTRVFAQNCIVFRPTTPKNTSARTTYTMFELHNVKIDALSNKGKQQQSYQGTLFYNIGISSTSGDTPVLKAGDFITEDMTVSSLPDQRIQITSVKECMRNGVLHHYECELA